MKPTWIKITSVLVLVLNAAVVACPMCKDSVPNSDAASSEGLPGGFNSSVYLILGTFLAVLSLVIGGIWRAVHTTPVMPRDGGRGFPLK